MRVRPIKSSAGYTVAGLITDQSFDTIKERDYIEATREYGILVMKQPRNVDTKAWVDFQMKVGYHQAAEIWCNDPEFPQIFRVTNKKLSGEQEGLFGHGELDWHCNILFTPDSEEIVSLRALEVPRGSRTDCANSIPFWNQLSQEKKDLYRRTKFRFTNKMEETYENKLAHYVLPTAEMKDFDKKRANKKIQGCMNYNEADDAFPESRFSKTGFHHLVPKHPLGIEGIYFPHLNMSYLCDTYHNPYDDHRAMYEEIKKEYLDSGKYTYQHEWETGDIIFMEQLSGVHRRNNVWQEQDLDPDAEKNPRELQRTAFWYKKKFRSHCGYCI